MIRLKILAALFSVAVAVTEEFTSLFPTSEARKVEKPQKSDEIGEADPVTDLNTTTTSTFTVAASVYFPEPSQTDSTPFITADGSRINKKNPKRHRWIAVSRDLHTRWGGDMEFGDSLMVTGVSDKLDGIYIVRDIMNRRMKNKIDILVGRHDKIMGLWKDVQIAKLD